MGTRTTVFRLPDGGVVVHAPGALDEGTRAEIRALGPVRAVVAPNLLHHMFYGAALEAFPGAMGCAAPGLAAKLKGARVDHALGDGAAPWGESLHTVAIEGMPSVQESVFLHPTSRTLVVTDVAFNFPGFDGWLVRTAMKLNDACGRFGPSWLCRNVLIKDKAAVRRSVDRLLEHDFDRVVVAHGAVLEAGGKDAMRAGYAWAG
jgi:Domain of unknown function (DUF4336)